MPTQIDHAVVLRLSDYSESSQIVTLFTHEAGLIRLIAKGVRRTTKSRPAVGLDLLELGEAEFAAARGEAGLGILAEWRQTDSFLPLRSDLPRLLSGLYAVELSAATTQEHDPHPELFDALVAHLRELSDGVADPIAAVVRFQAALLKSIGYAPQLRECVGCGKKRSPGSPAWFSSHAGGLLCRNCQSSHVEKHAIDPRLLDSPRGTTPPVGWFALLDYHLRHVAGRAFESSTALRRALAIGESHL